MVVLKTNMYYKIELDFVDANRIVYGRMVSKALLEWKSTSIPFSYKTKIYEYVFERAGIQTPILSLVIKRLTQISKKQYLLEAL